MEGYLGNTERWKGVAGALLVQGALLWLLIAGLAIGQSPALREKVDLFAMAKDQPPPPPAPQPKHNSAHEGAASPANLRSTATDLVAPQPVLPPPPQPIAAAPVANTGVQASQGAAPVEGPGSGAGGQGEGFGSGNSGDGAGAGGDTPPRRIGGRIKPGDLPDDLVFLLRSDQDYTVGVKYAVEEDGHVTDCRITRSSGNRALDTLTCQLIERKFRYRPALDEDGAAFRAWIVENHIWNFEDTSHNRR